ncbi:MAG: hypothetical protein PHU03_06670, partial [Syntrophales bacterium]|nr:hypothetical protein [Syntrophales bacterium]
MIRSAVGAAVVLIIICWCSAAMGKVYIDIDAPAFQQFPIAIQDFTVMDGRVDANGNAAWFADELGRLMTLTGFFRVIDRAAFLEDPAAAGITAPEISFGDWLSIGADFLVKGGFELGDSGLSSEFRLFDVVRGTLIIGKKYWGRSEDRKIMVMKFAEEILLALTGERGVFNTKIAFVAKRGDISNIYTVTFDGSDVQQVTDYNTLTLLPRWSPDGGMLSFISYITNNSDSYIINIATKELRVLTNFTGLNMPSDWSSDGRRILAVLSRDGTNDIYEINIATGHTRRLSRGPSIDVSPSWSPD